MLSMWKVPFSALLALGWSAEASFLGRLPCFQGPAAAVGAQRGQRDVGQARLRDAALLGRVRPQRGQQEVPQRHQHVVQQLLDMGFHRDVVEPHVIRYGEDALVDHFDVLEEANARYTAQNGVADPVDEAAAAEPPGVAARNEPVPAREQLIPDEGGQMAEDWNRLLSATMLLYVMQHQQGAFGRAQAPMLRAQIVQGLVEHFRERRPTQPPQRAVGVLAGAPFQGTGHYLDGRPVVEQPADGGGLPELDLSAAGALTQHWQGLEQQVAAAEELTRSEEPAKHARRVAEEEVSRQRLADAQDSQELLRLEQERKAADKTCKLKQFRAALVEKLQAAPKGGFKRDSFREDSESEDSENFVRVEVDLKVDAFSSPQKVQVWVKNDVSVENLFAFLDDKIARAVLAFPAGNVQEIFFAEFGSGDCVGRVLLGLAAARGEGSDRMTPLFQHVGKMPRL